MAIYVAMEPPAGAGRNRAEETKLVRDGFSWLAFFFPPLWLLWHRLWIEAILAFVVTGAVSALGEISDYQFLSSGLGLLVMLYVGLEGQALRIAALRRRGWREAGVIEADGLDDADTRYGLEAGAAPSRNPAAPKIIPDAAQARPAQTGMALGLTHNPGRT